MNEKTDPFHEETDWKAEYLRFSEHVRQQSVLIVSALLREQSERCRMASAIASRLCTEAANRKNRAEMEDEVQAGSFDLAMLGVQAEKPSNSETGWERD